MALQWDKSLAVGVKLIDEQHQELFRRVNTLLESMLKNQGKAEIEKLLGFLAQYVVDHFAAEEKLMLQHGYPGAPAHFTAHADLVMQLSDHVADHRAGEARLTGTLLAFLESWLLEHIQGMDRELGTYLRGRGLAS